MSRCLDLAKPVSSCLERVLVSHDDLREGALEVDRLLALTIRFLRHAYLALVAQYRTCAAVQDRLKCQVAGAARARHDLCLLAIFGLRVLREC